MFCTEKELQVHLPQPIQCCRNPLHCNLAKWSPRLYWTTLTMESSLPSTAAWTIVGPLWLWENISHHPRNIHLCFWCCLPCHPDQSSSPCQRVKLKVMSSGLSHSLTWSPGFVPSSSLSLLVSQASLSPGLSPGLGIGTGGLIPNAMWTALR